MIGSPGRVSGPEPGVISSYSHAWSQLWKYSLLLFLMLIIAGIISVPTSISQIEGNMIGPFLGIFAVVYGLLVEAPVSLGISFANLKAARGEKLDVADMFAAFYNYVNAILASLLVWVIIAIGLILFIIPGIYFACKLAFTPYLVVDRKMEATEAIRTSWRMTDGHALDVLGIALLAIPIGFAGLLVFGVGVIVSILWVNLAFASLYYAVSSKLGETQSRTEELLEIAKERYARGEIDREQFEQIRRELTWQ